MSNRTKPIKEERKSGLHVNLPNNLAVLYTDSVFVSTNDFGVVFDFAQTVGPTNQQNVIARLGMSKEHARAMLKVLVKKLELDINIKGLTKN